VGVRRWRRGHLAGAGGTQGAVEVGAVHPAVAGAAVAVLLGGQGHTAGGEGQGCMPCTAGVRGCRVEGVVWR